MLLLFALLACQQEDPTVGPALLHDPDGAFWDAPFPSNHRLRADGTVQIDDFPNPDGVPFVTATLGLSDRKLTGFGTTSTVYFASDTALPAEGLPDVFTSTEAGSPVYLVGLTGPDAGIRVPIDVAFQADGGPYGAPNQLSLLPLQGRPLAPNARYAAVVLRDLGAASGERLAMAPPLYDVWIGNNANYENADADALRDALEALDEEPTEIAGLTVFDTQDPTAEQLALAGAIAEDGPTELDTVPALTEVYDDYCVFQSRLTLPTYQSGDPPYLERGGGIAWGLTGPEIQGEERANVWITVPRGAAGPIPVVVFIRTGGGGDRPLIDRGFRATAGGPAEPGSGLAVQLAQAGVAGISVDGPHGGLRNVSGGDEQFLMFNVTNPEALIGNLQQSAAELTLLPTVLDNLVLDPAGCPDTTEDVRFDRIGLFGHSMGATIAPLVVGSQPRYDALMLSGAGGSWIANILYKQKPLDVKPLAEQMLSYPSKGRSLTADDPVLSLLQWAGERADPPVFGAIIRSNPDRQVFMAQGIVDRYILPPIANTTSLSLGLDLVGEAYDADHPELEGMRPLASLLPISGAQQRDLPVSGTVRAVQQFPEGPIEDGHEVLFQTDAAKQQFACFVDAWARGEGQLCP